jgi:hypothetical protein
MGSHHACGSTCLTPRFRRAAAPRAVVALAVVITSLGFVGSDPAAGAAHGAPVGASPVVREFPASGNVDVSLRFRWRADRRCTLVRFSANQISLFMRPHRLWVTGPRGTASIAPRRTGRSARLRVRLDVRHHAINVSLDGRRARAVHGKLVGESRVVVGRSGACSYTRISSVVVRASGRTSGTTTGRGAQPAGGARPQPATRPQPLAGPRPGGAGSPTGRPFAADSIWNAPLASDAPLDPQSNLLAGALRDEAKRELANYSGPYVATNSGVPVYTVPRSQATVSVTLDVWDFGTSLSETFSAGVPIPSDAVPANNPDQSLVIWQPSTDRMWEFFMLRKAPDGWHARWGGAIDAVSSSPGYFGAGSFPGASDRWGATASSLALAGGLMLHDEVEAFRIDHALALSVGSARKDAWAWPAQRSDGANTQPDAIPEGARFRLDPNLDLSKLDMPPITRAMAEAAQRYGIVVNNQSGQVLCFWAEDPTRYGVNYRTDLFDGLYPTQYLRSFPWDHLQLLKMDLHTPAG